MKNDGEFSQQKNTRVPMEPRYALRKRNHPQLQQHALLFLIQKFEKLTIHVVSDKDLSKSLKESVDPMGINFPPLPFTNWSKDWLGQKELTFIPRYLELFERPSQPPFYLWYRFPIV